MDSRPARRPARPWPRWIRTVAAAAPAAAKPAPVRNLRRPASTIALHRFMDVLPVLPVRRPNCFRIVFAAGPSACRCERILDCHTSVIRLCDKMSRILDINDNIGYVRLSSGRVRVRRSDGETGAKLMRKDNLAVVGHIGPARTGNACRPRTRWRRLAALGQPTRLAIFRLLMGAEPEGLPAGAIAETIGCPHNTLSSHLSILARSGLVRGTRDGRSIIYRADVDGMRTLIGFLVTDCCDGHPELCDLQEAIAAAECGCAPTGKSKKRRT